MKMSKISKPHFQVSKIFIDFSKSLEDNMIFIKSASNNWCDASQSIFGIAFLFQELFIAKHKNIETIAHLKFHGFLTKKHIILLH